MINRETTQFRDKRIHRGPLCFAHNKQKAKRGGKGNSTTRFMVGSSKSEKNAAILVLEVRFSSSGVVRECQSFIPGNMLRGARDIGYGESLHVELEGERVNTHTDL